MDIENNVKTRGAAEEVLSNSVAFEESSPASVPEALGVEKPLKEKNANFLRSLKEMAVCTFYSLILALVIVNFIGRVSVIQGASMQPLLYTDNRVLVNLLTYKFHEPKRGDVVVFQCPIFPNRDYIKRVIAMPGETLEICGGRVYIDGKLLEEPYLATIDLQENMSAVKISSEKYFVMGDNRVNSEDSRTWGPVGRNLIKGKASIILGPVSKFKVLR